MSASSSTGGDRHVHDEQCPACAEFIREYKREFGRIREHNRVMRMERNRLRACVDRILQTAPGQEREKLLHALIGQIGEFDDWTGDYPNTGNDI